MIKKERIMKKYAGWFVEGAPSLFPTLEDATAWRQAQIWDGGIGMAPMPEPVPLAHTHSECVACGRYGGVGFCCDLEVCFEVEIVSSTGRPARR